MLITLHLPDAPPATCRGYRHHVHTEITRDRARPAGADPRVAGRSRHDDFTVTREVDHLSPRLFGACASGRALPWVEVVLADPPTMFDERPLTPDATPLADDADPAATAATGDDGPPPPPVDGRRLRYRLEEVIVTSVLTSVEDGVPLETITLSYARVSQAWLGAHANDTTWAVYEGAP